MNKLKKIMLTVATSLIALTSTLTAASCDQIQGLLPDLIPGLGGHTHNLTKVEKVDATCTEAGHEAYFTCDGCDDIFADVNGTTVLEEPKVIAALGHKITGVAGSDATCTEDGVGDMFKCSRCDTLFSDKKGEHVIDKAPVIEALGHTLVETKAKEVSCTENGNHAYWTCTTCKKVYADKDAKTETTVEAQTIVAKGHQTTKTEANAADCTNAGNIEYWTCGTCNKVYADKDCQKEIALADTVIAAKGHAFNETLVVTGAVTSYQPGENFNTTNLVVKLDCDNCDHFETVTDYTLSKSTDLQPEDTAIVISYVKGGKTYTATINISVVHVHTTGDLIPAVPATCTETGTLAYYECDACKAKFEDAAATKPLADIVVKAKGHNGVKTEAKDSSCTEAGNNAYWTCDACDKVFEDEACTKETTVEDMKLPLSKHDTTVKSDDEGHWDACGNCDYTSDKEAHNGVAYPDAAAECTVCGKTFGEASTEGWVLYRPSVNAEGALIKSASHVDVDGIKASQYVFNAAKKDTTAAIWTHKEKDAYNSGKYQVRIPAVANKARALYVYVANNSDVAVSFRMFSENNGDVGGTDITLDANASGWYKFTVTDKRGTVGSNVNFKLLSDLEAEATITVYGYFHLEEDEIANLKAANQEELKLSYKVGEKFDLSKMILSANIITNKEGKLLADGSNVETYYIANNFTVEGIENNHVFTADEVGEHTVTVSFGGKSFNLTVRVSTHTHAPELVEKKAATCTEDGYEAYYVCNVDGCGQKFKDADGNEPITEITVIPAGHRGAALPGHKAICNLCKKEFGEVRGTDNWVYYNVTTNKGSTNVVNGKLEAADVEGMSGTKITIGAGTKKGNNFQLCMGDNDANRQTVIPNLGANAGEGDVRNVVLFYKNYSNQAITLKLENDRSYENGVVTIPANGTATVEFSITNGDQGGSNWFYLHVENDVTEDVVVGVYGYFYINEGEVSELKLEKAATKLSFTEGETFTAEGLVINAKIPSKTTKNVYVATGFTTDLDGYTFTAADVAEGKKTVTVTFAGKTMTYEITVAAHAHQLHKVEKAMVECISDGVETYWECTVDGCGAIFSDENGSKQLAAPIVIPCHENVGIPGTKVTCSKCSKEYTVSTYNWVYYNVTTQTGGIEVKDGKVEVAEVEGMSGTKITIGAGTTKGQKFVLCMNNNDADRQTVIPNLGANAGEGNLRNVVLFYKNYSNQDITLNLQNDNKGGNGSVTVPANGTAICEFTIKNVGGSNWFHLFVDSDVTEDVVVGVYGYFYVHNSEVSELTIKNPATKLTYKVGDTFSADGLALNAKIPSGTPMTLYVSTGYITNFDGHTFTANEVGEHTVLVTFAGQTIEYTITVEA